MTGSGSDPIHRREVLRTVAAVGPAVGLAGCGSGPGGTTTEPPSTRPTATPESGPTVYAGFLDSKGGHGDPAADCCRERPWQTGYAAQLRDARRALDKTPLSVVDNGAADGVDSHRFATSGNRTDYRAAIEMGTWIRDLGLGYVFTGTERFARQAIKLLNHWFLSPETRMHPSGQNFGETYFSIEPTSRSRRCCTVRRWSATPQLVDGRGDPQRAPNVGRIVSGRSRGRTRRRQIRRRRAEQHLLLVAGRARATAAAYLGDRAALERVFDDWRANALDQLQPNGLLKHERQRADGLAYSVYGLKALTLTAEIARHFGVDLYGYRLDDDDTSALLRAFKGHQEYVLTPTAGRGALARTATPTRAGGQWLRVRTRPLAVAAPRVP